MLSGLARSLHREHDPHATLADVVEAAVELIPGTEDASITAVVDRRHVASEAASSPLPRMVDALQEETGEGPCLDAIDDRATVLVADMATETRWPRFAARAAATGAGSMLSLQLYVDGDNLGSLNLYSHHAGAFDEESEHVGVLFASYAAIAYDAARTRSQLARAVDTRQLIGQAQGLLIAREHLSADQAFALLVRTSQHQNTRLRSRRTTGHHRAALTSVPATSPSRRLAVSPSRRLAVDGAPVGPLPAAMVTVEAGDDPGR